MIVAIPEDLRQVLGPEGTRALAELLNRIGHEMRDDVIAISEERFQRHLADQLAGLRGQIARLESTLREQIAAGDAALREQIAAGDAALRKEMVGGDAGLRGDMARMETRLIDRMNRLETGLLRWSFGFWVTQLVALGALIFTLFRLAHP